MPLRLISAFLAAADVFFFTCTAVGAAVAAAGAAAGAGAAVVDDTDFDLPARNKLEYRLFLKLILNAYTSKFFSESSLPK